MEPRSITERWLRTIVSANEITEVFLKEVRCGSSVVNLVGFYDAQHLPKLATDLEKFYGIAKGIYFRINPVRKDLVCRSPNQLSPTSTVQCGTGGDITRRRLMMIDIDAMRPSGTNSTNEEKWHARQIRDSVVVFLKEQGWPAPAFIDTGNGYCLFYRVDLPVSDDGLIRKALRHLHQKFSTDKAHVDISVHDPARLARLPGTINGKGEPTEARPQRPCRLLRLPRGGCKSVVRGLLEKLVDSAPRSAKGPIQQSADSASPEVINRARAYISKMPPAVSGAGGDPGTFTVACRLVIGFGLSREDAIPLMREYNSRCSPPWSETELERKIDAAIEHGRSTGESRGVLAANIPTKTPPRLDGGMFYGHVPDFGDAGALDILAPIRAFANWQQHGWIEYFCTWQKLKFGIDIPDVFLRQCHYGAAYPRNWRKRFKTLLGSDTLEETKKDYRCAQDFCIFHGLRLRHSHFPDHGVRWGVLEHFADSDGEERSFLLYDDQFKPKRKELRALRKIFKVYWPALLFAGARSINWTAGQQRLLVGLVAELTQGVRQGVKGIAGELVVGNQVVGAANRAQIVTCPHLKANVNYVTFGGNGPAQLRARGYQIMGRTNRGWLWRAGYPDCRRLRDETRNDVIGQLLKNLGRLSLDLGLIVVGYNYRHRTKWKDLDELIHCLKSGNGRDWLHECAIRVYTCDDWLIRWRHFFSERLGFSWIPSVIGDEGPWDGVSATSTDRQVSKGSHVRLLLSRLEWTQQQLADAASKILGKKVSRRRIMRHIQESSRSEPFLDALDLIRQREGIELPK